MLLTETLIIRKAEPQDTPAMLELIKELAAFEKEPEAVTVSLEHFTHSGFGDNPVWWAFNAFEGNKLIGMAIYYIRYSTWKGQTMYLEDIIITENKRGLGVGSLLMEHLIAEARKRQLSAISWQVLNWNKQALEFYGKYPIEQDEDWINIRLEC